MERNLFPATPTEREGEDALLQQYLLGPKVQKSTK